MIVLFDTPAGYSLFKVSNEKKLAKTDPEDIHRKFFSTASDATSFVNLLSFQPFIDTADAVSAATACIEGKVSKSLKSFLKKQTKNHKGDSLAVLDKNLAVDIKDKVSGVDIVSDAKTLEIFRGIRTYMDELLENSASDVPAPTGADIRAMQLGLSHSLSRYKLKFSADKVDTMVIQAVGLLDELDKEINTYAMRVKEWYGWHFPGKSILYLYVYIVVFLCWFEACIVLMYLLLYTNHIIPTIHHHHHSSLQKCKPSSTTMHNTQR